MEKRRHPRVVMKNLFVYVNDGNILSHGTIMNVCRDGLAMTDLSKRLHTNEKKMTIVVSGNEIDFRMYIRPRWFIQGSVKKTMGAQIVTAPSGWIEFVMSHEPVIKNKPPEILI